MRRVPGTPFAADYWQAQEDLRYYFLSHMHADHTHGLSDSWALGTIYCSPITKALLHLRWPGIARDLVVPLEEGETHLVFLDEARSTSMTVALIPANHCPGAVMFLWQGYFGSLLYTGDFRFHPSMVEEGPLAGMAVDTLFLDNTYLDSSFEFPSQQEALEMLLAELKKRPNIREYAVLVGIDTLGKERLLVDLALHFGTFVEVQPERYRALQAIHRLGGLSDAAFAVFFDSEQIPPRDIPGPVFVLSSKTGLGMALNERQHLLKEAAPTRAPLVLGVVPTGWVHVCEDKKVGWMETRGFFSFLLTSFTPPKGRFADYAAVLKVPYSIHSSYREILELVRRVRPVRVVPIVPTSPCPFAVLQPLLATERQLPPVVIPEAIAAERKPEPAFVAPKREREAKPEKPLIVSGAARSRKRIGVSDEKMAQIASAIARNSERLGIAGVPKQERDVIDVDEVEDEVEAIEEEDDENEAPSAEQLMAMFERSRERALQQQSL